MIEALRVGVKKKSARGFTIVELLIVIVIIAILSTLVIVTYAGIQQRARNTALQNAVRNVHSLIEIYKIDHGTYPITTNNPKANWHAADVMTDDNCSNGSGQVDWIPGYSGTLPQSDPAIFPGVDDEKGCYLYVSDGADYVISAWNMLSAPQAMTFYRRLGFREFQSSSSTQFYTCNNSGIGGVSGGTYNSNQDYYKHSYTISNITDCNETPPAGA